MLILLLGPAGVKARTALRIISGSMAYTVSYPWMVSIDVYSENYTSVISCGGTLISPEWVMSAGHCYLNDDHTVPDPTAAGRTKVFLNSDTYYPLSQGYVSRTVEQIIFHPAYKPDYYTSPNPHDYDIALLQLSSPVDFLPVPLMDDSGPALPAGTETIVMGWGATGVDFFNTAVNYANDLLQVGQQIVSQVDCGIFYPSTLTDNMICANAIEPGGTGDSCSGDSGGPMVAATPSGFVQVGIVSFGGVFGGPICGDPYSPAVYTRISALGDFIGQHVGDAAFQSVTPIQSVCAAPANDAQFSLIVPCITYGGQTFSATLTLADPDQLLWQWNGLFGSSGCDAPEAVCAILGDDLSLTLPNLSIGQQTYTVVLDYAGSLSDGGKHIWQYSDHY